jgi:hypothetical protein
MRIARWAVLTVVVATALAIPAQAQTDLLSGPWLQIESNAGPCPTCRISIDGIGSLAVTANNGWSATIVAAERHGLIAAAGNGRWRSPNNPLDGKPFNVDFELRGDRLYMSMRIELGKGAMRTVRAVFGRPWLGS